MKFREVTLAYSGVKGIVPQSWTKAGEARFTRGVLEQDPTQLYLGAYPQIDVQQFKVALAPKVGTDAFPEQTGRLATGGLDWALYTFEPDLPIPVKLLSSFALAQAGTWTCMVSLGSLLQDHETLYETVFVPAVKAFELHTETFGLLNGGDPVRVEGRTLAEELGYTDQHTLVVVHADDVGAHPDQLDGMLEAIEAGMCKTGSVMAPCPDFERTLSIWRQRPDLDLGIHLTLNSEWGARYGWSPLLPRSEVPSLYTPDGLMWPTEQDLRAHMDVGQALRECEAQIVKVLEAGVRPTHIDEHMGCFWQHPDLTEGVMRLSKKYRLPMSPVDMDRMRDMGYLFPDSSWQFVGNVFGDQRYPEIRQRVYADWLRGLGPGVHQVMTHIARVSDDYASKINGAYFRAGDLACWTSAKVRAMADELGITFLGYREIYDAQLQRWDEADPQVDAPIVTHR
jgi:predicted glycoside hydrolase/deacetylase ChbG (UPF0249 family)